MADAFNIVSLIEKKKFGEPLSEEALRFWIRGVVEESIELYQSSAMLMAIRLKGMNFDEMAALTRAMTDSGARMRFPGRPLLADKHSTGGIGDKVTLILGPLAAACSLPVTMLSGRGLGHTGGTIDKFESLQGLSCARSNDEMNAMLDQFGWANAQSSREIAPADRVLYKLRDVTATVDSEPLITASILSKKIAGGANQLCLDVKCGSGAFMRDLDQARSLATSLKRIGEMNGLTVTGCISRMEEPLGHAVGNYLELLEAVHYLREAPDTPLMRLIFRLTEQMLVSGGCAADSDAAQAMMVRALQSGEALSRLTAYLAFCGGETSAIDQLLSQGFEDLPHRVLHAPKDGVIRGIQGRGLGELLVTLGAGRKRVEDAIDPIAGVQLLRHCGDFVRAGDPLLRLYGERRDAGGVDVALLDLFDIGEEPSQDAPIILDEI